MDHDSLTPEEEEEDEDEESNNIARFGLESRYMLPTSPSERLWSQTISSTLERRMNKHVYKDGKRCLIENTKDGALHYVHCLSRRLDPPMMDLTSHALNRTGGAMVAPRTRVGDGPGSIPGQSILRHRRINDLEFAWGMRRGTLNLDTRSNVFCLSAKMQALWEEDKWILIPEDDILERYLAAQASGEAYPDIGEGPYKYRFFAHLDMESVAIHRQISFPENETESLKADHFMFSASPFKNLGILTSHLHPKFAICHIGARTVSANDIVLSYCVADQAARELLAQCMRIISLWSSYGKDIASKDRGFMKTQITPDDVYSETSDRTANCRLLPHLSDQRLIEEHGYVYVKEDNGIVKLKHKEDTPHLLTAKKLRISRGGGPY